MRSYLAFFTAALSGAGAMAQASSAADIASDPESFPVVLTPARLRQSLQDVPASVTIITSEKLRKFGITSVPDALRMVPGMEVTQPTGTDVRINYHGTNILSPRRMNVLIDGVSVYQPAFTRVDWPHLPVTVEDIDRIEVTRGSNSAAYGPNSMMAIINIITKHPSDVERGFASTTIGSRGERDTTGRFSATLGPTSLRLTVNKHQDDGYDFLSRVGVGHDSTSLDRLNARSQTKLSSTTTLDVDTAYVAGTQEVPIADQYQTSFPDQKVQSYYLSAKLVSNFSPDHELQIRASHWSDNVRQQWSSCMPTTFFLPEIFNLWQANPNYANAVLGGRVPTGGTANDDALAALARQAIANLGTSGASPRVCGTPNFNIRQTRSDIELQDTFVFSEKFRAVTGIGARRDLGDSPTFLGETVTNMSWRVFGNIEAKPRPWLNINAGAYVEKDQLTGSSFSPRLAANVHLSPLQSLRFVWTQGTRSPAIYEQRAKWIYSVTDATPQFNGSNNVTFFQSGMSPGGLRSERIDSKEIGYLLNVPTWGLVFDAKIFDDHLTDLISEKLQVSSFAPTNNNSVRLSGAEFQINSEISASWSAFLNYSYLVNHDASTIIETSQYSRHSGALGINHSFGDGWAWSLAWYGASADGPGQGHYGREDVTLSKSFRIDGARARASIIARRLDNKSPPYFRDIGSAPISSYDNRVQILGQIQVSF